ncbi:hypothetical protein Tco_0961282 [Tanacetum coccineum]
MGRPTTSLSLRPGPKPLLPDGNFPHIAINVFMSHDLLTFYSHYLNSRNPLLAVHGDSTKYPAIVVSSESISRHNQEADLGATPPGRMQTGMQFLAPETLFIEFHNTFSPAPQKPTGTE